MKVRLVFNVEVDPAEWDFTYGTGTRSREVVEDVRRYFLTHCQESAACQETGATVEVSR